MIATALIWMSGLGVLQALAGLLAVWRFCRQPLAAAASLPSVTVLKPVCGDELWLEDALRSFFAQDYPDFQIVIGAQDAGDPALAAARRLQAEFPHRDLRIVVDPAVHGANRKISNLMNMLPAARHDVLVFADSDLHVRPGYLRQVVATLLQPGTGLVTTVCGGEAAAPGVAAGLGAMHISHSFLPGALLGAALGRQDCLGNTMAIRRDTLAAVGGLAALVPHLADDNLLGRLVRGVGLAVRLAPCIPVVTVQERSLRALWVHELRWARTVRSSAPFSHAMSVLMFPVLWAALALAASGFGWLEASWLLGAWALRAAVADGIDRQLRGRRARRAMPARVLLLPLRDLLSVLQIAMSFCQNAVVWRGHTLRADDKAMSRAALRGVPAAKLSAKTAAAT